LYNGISRSALLWPWYLCMMYNFLQLWWVFISSSLNAGNKQVKKTTFCCCLFAWRRQQTFVQGGSCIIYTCLYFLDWLLTLVIDIWPLAVFEIDLHTFNENSMQPKEKWCFTMILVIGQWHVSTVPLASKCMIYRSLTKIILTFDRNTRSVTYNVHC